MSVSALEENIAREAAGASILVDVSADAFGLGIGRVARAARAAGAEGLFVMDVDGALAARTQSAGLDVHVGRTNIDRRSELDSAGIVAAEEVDARVVRDAAYGLDGHGSVVASLRTEILSTKSIRAGDGVSYGYTYRAVRDERTALVGLGYGDGVHRHAGNRCRVLVDGVSVPIVGRVAMNVFVVSLGDRIVDEGAPVVVFGDPVLGEPSLREWSDAIAVRPLSVLASIGERVERTES